MAILNRITLKNFFRKGSVPTETNFADLIDSSINIVEDGIGRSIDDGFRIRLHDANPEINAKNWQDFKNTVN